MKNGKPNRAERAIWYLRSAWRSSLDLVWMVGTTTPSKVLSEVRAMGVELETRKINGIKYYRVKR